MVDNTVFGMPSINNIHECRRYLIRLHFDHDVPIEKIDLTSLAEMNYHIQTNLYQISDFDKNKTNSMYQLFKKEYDNESRVDDDLGQLLTDDRVNFYAWLFLMVDIESNEIKLAFYFPETQRQASNKKERAECILSVFNGWLVKKEIKLKKIDEIKKAFLERVIEFKSPLKWLNQKNKEQCQWALDYTINYLNKGNCSARWY